MIRANIGVFARSGSGSEKINPPAFLNGADTFGLYMFDEPSTVTKDGSNLVSPWADYYGSGRNLAEATNKPVWSSTGILFDGVNDILKVTATLAQPVTVYLVARQISHTNTDSIFDGNTRDSCRLLQATPTPGLKVLSSFLSAANNELTLNTFKVIRVIQNGVNSKLSVNNLSEITFNGGSGSMGGFTLGAAGDSTLFSNIEVKAVLIRRGNDTDENKTLIYNFLTNRYGTAEKNKIAISGDSTVGYHLTYPSVGSLMNNIKYEISDIATSGDTISAQVTKWGSVPNKSQIKAVFVEIGLNDLALTTSALITAYQNYVNQIRTDIGVSGKIIGCTMIPCNRSSDQQWIDLNQAILGGGATPITGLDSTIDTVNTALNNGSNGLAVAYDSGDALHENTAGRQIISNLYDSKLNELFPAW